MSLLPENKPKAVNYTPKLFVFGGAAMSGKTYSAIQFPSPLLINTDGNCMKVDTPSVYLNDKKYTTYKQKIETLLGVMKELNDKPNCGYKTIIIDLIEDIFDIIEGYILEKYNVKNLADVKGFATGYTERKRMMTDLISAFKTLANNYYVIITTHTVDKIVDDKMVNMSLLKEDFYILLEGKTDCVATFKKMGNTYISRIVKSRHDYKNVDIQKNMDKEIVEALKRYE